MTKPKAPRVVLIHHLLVRTEIEPLHLERFRGICGANGITKREYKLSIAEVDCPLCLSKMKGKLK
jgi:hypothetical protein